MHRALSALGALMVSLLLLACQSVPDDALQEVYPIYGSESEAMAVAAGQLGATPISLLSRSEADALIARAQVDGVSLASRGPNAPVWRLSLPDGRVGWAPKSTWP